MGFSKLFIDRPILAGVISVLIMLVGAVAYFGLPVSQYPEVAPPSISVTAAYPGANAETVAATVASPLEQEINGVEGMLYISSQSTSDGRVTITATFALGTDLDEAQLLVQNRVNIALPRLPEEVRRLGVVSTKNTPDILMVVHIYSPDDTRDQLYLSNYTLQNIRDRLVRLDGVGDIRLFGAREYSMRVWLDPQRIASFGMTAGEVVQALRGQTYKWPAACWISSLDAAGGIRDERPAARTTHRPRPVRRRAAQEWQRWTIGPRSRHRSHRDSAPSTTRPMRTSTTRLPSRYPSSSARAPTRSRRRSGSRR